MRKTISRVLKIVALALVILLILPFWTNITGFLSILGIGQPPPSVIATTQISHELREVGVLTTMQYTDTGTFTATIPAVIIGTAQRVTVPYEYRIDYGVDLEHASIAVIDEGLLSVTLPPADVVHDTLRVTGKVEVFDFLYPLTEERYQQILDEQTETLRQAYLDDPSHAQAAYETAKVKVGALLESMLDAQGARETWSITFGESAEG